MREKGLKAIQPRSFVPRTTNSSHSLGYSPNLLLGMKLPPDKPLEVIVGDITFLPLQGGGWCYLRPGRIFSHAAFWAGRCRIA